MDDIYGSKTFETNQFDNHASLGRITEKDKFLAAKQILLGIAILYVITLAAYIFNPDHEDKLIGICTTIFPPLATIILISYFKDKHY